MTTSLRKSLTAGLLSLSLASVASAQYPMQYPMTANGYVDPYADPMLQAYVQTEYDPSAVDLAETYPTYTAPAMPIYTAPATSVAPTWPTYEAFTPSYTASYNAERWNREYLQGESFYTNPENGDVYQTSNQTEYHWLNSAGDVVNTDSWNPPTDDSSWTQLQPIEDTAVSSDSGASE
jgi:hypothetical protein